MLDHVVIDANGLIIWEIVGSYVIDVNDLVIDWYDALDENDICPSGNQSIQRWIISVLSWLIRCTNGWTPKWSPYGESPHGKMLYRLGYPRRNVGGPMLVWGITRWK